jgi:hypothetical protein
VGPNRDPSKYNAWLAKYTAAIERLARLRGAGFIDLAQVYEWYESQPLDAGERRPPLTENGLHLSEYGYWRTAPWFRERLCAGTSQPAMVLPTEADAAGLLAHFDRQSQTFKLDALSEAQQRGAAACLQFTGRLSSLPLPDLDGRAAASVGLRVTFAHPGRYRMEIDGAPAGAGNEQAWIAGAVPLQGPDELQSRELLTAIRRKNELYFHRWRPQNVTYLFLFRKHEQGNNAAEIPQFDPLIAREEARIAELKLPQRREYRLVRDPDR